MAWFPWAALPARSNMTTGEVVEWLRSRAIDFGAPALFIDALDDLVLAETAQEEIDELRERLKTVEVEHDALRDALVSLLAGPKDAERIKVAREVLAELK